MALRRSGFALLPVVGLVVLAAPGASVAQNAGTDVPPVIDVHHHAMVESFPGMGPMCPSTSAFAASDPGTKEAPCSISVIQNADYLTPKQKRAILYLSAARFLRLEGATARR